MFFKSKFFLDLSGGKDDQPASPAVVAPVKEKAAPAKAEAPKPAHAAVLVAPVAQSATASVPAKAAAEPAAAPAPAANTALTTAESIAAELAAAQANRPAPSLATFAPEALVPGGSTPQRRRSGGANLAGFKAIARSFVKN
jgi:hypothetical protein